VTKNETFHPQLLFTQWVLSILIN